MIDVISRDRACPVLALCAAIVAGCAAAPTRPAPPRSIDPGTRESRNDEPEPDLASLKAKVVEAHNRVRAKAKLPSLAVSERLEAAAEAHAKDMAERRKMTHKGSRGTAPADRIKAQGYLYRRCGENIAVGYLSVERLMKVWMDSPPHKKNILGGFSQIGVGCAIAEDGKPYWCVTFGLPIRR